MAGPADEEKKQEEVEQPAQEPPEDDETYVEQDDEVAEENAGDEEVASNEEDQEVAEEEDAEDEEDVEDDEDEQEEEQEDEEEIISEEDGSGEDAEDQKGTKRKPEPQSQAGTSKMQKTNGSSKVDASKPNAAAAEGKVGSKHDEPRDPSTQGSNSRLPEKGQQVHWKALPGYVDGEVVEILTSSKEVDGKSVKASEDDPRIVLKSNKSGKICVHKADAVYFD
ncbi:hypothetical protein JX265_006138 [Neoarthrinium moseri]|uniref:Hypervirulence associated protein TUDOR domain-containing protein n=1 Tax=Neoarthrinium moseri TaxID=1658444 RepID=A0A9P9WMV5_9PEZI|nr:hypothetical protein JX265_006138 [Neoarthrinium moseri]